jgi:Tfp pilus assembly protein PilF
LLLFALLQLATGYRWRSAAVALLFAIHPLHVESVAWVTERKDVLSTLFWLLAMLAYLRYAARASVGRYLLVAALFALGLMAKPMLVTLPLTLLLLDVWPLRRIDPGAEGWGRGLWRCVWEKIPLFVMSAASCVITIAAQDRGQSMFAIAELPMGARVSNALVAYISYIAKMLCPLNLMPQYPHPGPTLPVWHVAGSAVLLALMTVIAVKSIRRRPYLTVGWLWYIVTLIPVIGLIQVGMQAMADRYTYVPLIGLFVVAAWGVPEVLTALRVTRPSPVWLSLGGAIALALMVTSCFQVSYWRDTTSLAEHALVVNDKSYTAHLLRGDAYAQNGDYEQAVAEYRRSLRMAPFSAQTSFSLAQTLCKMERFRESAEEFKRTLKMWPYHGDVHYEAGALLVKMGQLDRALNHFRCALSLGYECPAVYVDMGYVYAHKHDMSKAKQCFVKALRLDPNDKTARSNLRWADQQLTRKTSPSPPKPDR